MSEQTAAGKPALKPLAIKCTSSKCEDGLHCFKATRKLKASGDEGACRSCGVKLVDWPRIRQLDPADAAHTLTAMRLELIRHHFWHVAIDEDAVVKARRKGKTGLEAAVPKRIRQSVGKEKPFRDGQQTPFVGNVIYYAQHATASCCRTCMEYWHGIPKGRALTDAEVEYLSRLAMLFITERLPDLPQEGERATRKYGEKSQSLAAGGRDAAHTD
ncbi:DUF4186 family protein [Fimbriiglobus ruber]|uniref:DUF4186 domain-containing protein n=1 Tax=Fimbriiglobus ruber TaxID=1908690 RepID=A0A225DCN0_9BACT|nr:DUF4186 family protein [Fimbriiglobus ruber]OWK37394.1 hypothetical protein FRUB_06514 [Fimbriiglobus ruber]